MRGAAQDEGVRYAGFTRPELNATYSVSGEYLDEHPLLFDHSRNYVLYWTGGQESLRGSLQGSCGTCA